MTAGYKTTSCLTYFILFLIIVKRTYSYACRLTEVDTAITPSEECLKDEPTQPRDATIGRYS